MADCKNMNCPFRANDSSNKYRCECVACERRWDGSKITTSNRAEMDGIETATTSMREMDGGKEK